MPPGSIDLSKPTTVVRGIHRVPGDKSITHRALMMASLARGRSEIRGALTSDDARSSARVLRQLGSAITPLRPGALVAVTGRGALRASAALLDCGNSGTTARLLLGTVAAHRFESTLTGDRSLRRRPMRRVTDPLVAMGARVVQAGAETLPLTIAGGSLHALHWTLPVASAQVKSAILLAGAVAGVEVTLDQPAASRDHTERMLRHFGYSVQEHASRVILRPGGAFVPFVLDVPGDPSSAIFLAAAAALASRGEIAIEAVGLNPSRIAFIDIMNRMNIRIHVEEMLDAAGEPVGTIVAAASDLVATDIRAAETPGVIDEIPMLACLASRARGTSRLAGLAELRVKESDRLALVANNLRNVGVEAAVDGDDLIVAGTDVPPVGRVVTHGDHRIAMAFAVLGTLPGARVTIDDRACASVSFPGFDAALAALFGGPR
ncbi:MAG TPA: 3-phosphoshikimate 1-carboxyvinyltransferase [Gemmatimonadales bacterium]